MTRVNVENLMRILIPSHDHNTHGTPADALKSDLVRK